MKIFAVAIAICTKPASQRNTRMDCITASFRALRSVGYFIRRAARRGTLAIRSNPPISFTQNLHPPGNVRNPRERPRPPNLTGQRHARIRAAKLRPIGKQEPQFPQQFFPRHSEQRSHARVLQRRKRHPAPLQGRRQPSRDARAKAALRIKEQPSLSVSALPVRKLTRQRNHDPFVSFSPACHSSLATSSLRPQRLCANRSSLCPLCALCLSPDFSRSCR